MRNQHVLFKSSQMFSPTDFFKYLKRPTYLSYERKETNVVLSALQIYLLFILFVGLINSLSITILKTFVNIPIDKTLDIPEFLKSHLFIYFLFLGIYTPFMEEIVFRLPLVYSSTNVALSLATLTALIAHKIIGGFMPIIIFLGLFFIIFKCAQFYNKLLLTFWHRYYSIVFYFLSLSFGFAHITNYTYTVTSQFFIAPILVFPQIALGLVLSFSRIYYRRGFLISIVIHCFLNMVSVLIYILQSLRA